MKEVRVSEKHWAELSSEDKAAIEQNIKGTFGDDIMIVTGRKTPLICEDAYQATVEFCLTLKGKGRAACLELAANSFAVCVQSGGTES